MNAAISTKQLDFNKATNSFVAEISDFGHGFNFCQIYHDSADQGLKLISHKTGHEADFVVSREFRDTEGELTHYELVPTAAAIRHNRGLCGVKMVIFND